MPDTTSQQHPIPPTHEDYRWIFGPGKDQLHSDFIELTRDITAGVGSSLQIIYASELAREINLDADPADQLPPPAIGKTDAANLMRLSMAAIQLLHHSSLQRIDTANQFWHDQAGVTS